MRLGGVMQPRRRQELLDRQGKRALHRSIQSVARSSNPQAAL